MGQLSVVDLNLALAKALGVTDMKVTKIVLTIQAGDLPVVQVFKPLFVTDDFETVMESYGLIPSKQPPEPKR